MLRIVRAHTPQVHKNIPSLNTKLKTVVHLIKIKPFKLPQEKQNGDSTCIYQFHMATMKIQ